MDNQVYEALQKVPHSKVFRKEDIPRHFFYTYNQRIMPYILMMDEGYMTCCYNNTDKHDHGHAPSRKLFLWLCYMKLVYELVIINYMKLIHTMWRLPLFSEDLLSWLFKIITYHLRPYILNNQIIDCDLLHVWSGLSMKIETVILNTERCLRYSKTWFCLSCSC